ncbi:MAG: hypothetical protein QM676_02175 [Novosphingobium sp.]
MGNAGSFGIGSGTSDSISTSTSSATSDGYHSTSTDSSTDNSFSLKTISNQDLQATTSNTQVTVNAGADPSGSPLPTGTNAFDGMAFSNYAGILTINPNTGHSAITQSGTSFAINATVSPN